MYGTYNKSANTFIIFKCNGTYTNKGKMSEEPFNLKNFYNSCSQKPSSLFAMLVSSAP